jgi:Protein of unknown function (DUF3311)
MTEATTRSRSAIAAHPVTSAAITILVAADIFLALYVPLYSRLTPKWGDFPFFYWYLLIVMPVTSLLLWLAALLQKRLTGPGAAVPGSTAPGTTPGSAAPAGEAGSEGVR